MQVKIGYLLQILNWNIFFVVNINLIWCMLINRNVVKLYVSPYGHVGHMNCKLIYVLYILNWWHLVILIPMAEMKNVAHSVDRGNWLRLKW